VPRFAISHEPPGYECPFCILMAGGQTSPSQQRHIVARTPETLTLVNPRFWPNDPGSLIVVPIEHHENLYVLPDEVGAAVHRAVGEAACALRLAYGCQGTSTRQDNEPAGHGPCGDRRRTRRARSSAQPRPRSRRDPEPSWPDHLLALLHVRQS